MLSGLLQSVIDWANSLEDRSGGFREQKEHLVTRPELCGLGWSVVHPLLVPLGGLHMLLNDLCYSVNLLLHFLDVLYQGAEGPCPTVLGGVI